MFLNPPSCPKRSSKQSYCENLPPRNNCNILFILILYCGLCPCSQSHHSVRWFVVDLSKRFSATPKKNMKMFSSFTLLLVYDVTWVMVRRYVVTIVIWQRVMTHLGLPHPAVVPFARFHLWNEDKIKLIRKHTQQNSLVQLCEVEWYPHLRFPWWKVDKQLYYKLKKPNNDNWVNTRNFVLKQSSGHNTTKFCLHTDFEILCHPGKHETSQHPCVVLLLVKT